MKKKKPDYIVFDEKSKKYDASVRKFPTSLSAPNFSTLEVNKTIPFECRDYFETKSLEINKEIERLVNEFEWTKLIYNSEYSFQPKVGVKYYLYQREDMSSFLSLISPNEWDKKLIGKFRLKSDGRWILED